MTRTSLEKTFFAKGRMSGLEQEDREDREFLKDESEKLR
jgi:hypothetical protein